MPVYSYLCRNCGEKFDLLVGVVSEKTEVKCPKCGSSSIEKTFASFGINVSSKNKNINSCGESCPRGNCPMKNRQGG